jgi:hypothetical protein
MRHRLTYSGIAQVYNAGRLVYSTRFLGAWRILAQVERGLHVPVDKSGVDVFGRCMSSHFASDIMT